MLCINNFFLLYTVNRVNVICHKIYYLNLKIRKKYIILVLKHKIEQTKKKNIKRIINVVQNLYALSLYRVSLSSVYFHTHNIIQFS